MNAKKQYIYDLANFLYSQGKKMSIEELANHLNRNGVTTDAGGIFKGKRGTYKLVDAVYNSVEKAKGKAEAGKVAVTFERPQGGYAYE